MLNKSALLAAACATLALAACGGSGGGDNAPSFEELNTRQEAIKERLGTVEAATALPTTGTATYAGVGIFDLGNDRSTDMLSELRLQADFATNQVGGEFSNFVTSEGRNLDGNVAIENSVVNQTSFDAVAAGTVDGKAVDFTMEGQFQGKDVEAVVGTMDGTFGNQNLGGDFITLKQ